MIITKYINPLTKERTYQISINWDEDIDAEEIVECFKEQYPKTKAVILFTKIRKLELGIMIVGLGNLK